MEDGQKLWRYMSFSRFVWLMQNKKLWLINEVHSFGMIFTGCFWDLIANLFGASASKTEATLLTAVGRGMMLGD